MKFVQHEGGLALKDYKNKVLGWVLLSLDGKYVYKISSTKEKSKFFNTREQAKNSLVEKIYGKEI